MVRVKALSGGIASRPKRFAYVALGTVSLVLGLIGVVLPVIPTTPLILFSAWCYYRGSKRFHDWLVGYPYFGKIIAEYSGEEGMKKESKIKALLFTWVAVLLTAVFILESDAMRALIILIGFTGTVVILRLKTRKD
jgi:uncharacterized membrane protein YbaN (DUF454 family)